LIIDRPASATQARLKSLKLPKGYFRTSRAILFRPIAAYPLAAARTLVLILSDPLPPGGVMLGIEDEPSFLIRVGSGTILWRMWALRRQRGIIQSFKLVRFLEG
jgi:hypothetical protein